MGGDISGINLTGFILQQVREIFMSTLVVYPTRRDPSKYSTSRACYDRQVFFGCLSDSEVNRSDCLGGQCAIFDIDSADDQQTFVLTPFQLPLECTPTKYLRRMSISRVVERAESRQNLDEYETFRTKEWVKGMWQRMMFPGGRYNLV